MRRRFFLASVVSSAFIARSAEAQLVATVYSEEPRISAALGSAMTIEEVEALATEWDAIYGAHMSSLDQGHKDAMDELSAGIVGLIEGVVKDEAKRLVLVSLVPKTLEAFEALANRFKYLGPLFAFIEASAPSTIATDATEVHFANQAMQKRVRDRIHIVTGEPLFYETLYLQMDLKSSGPSIGLD